MRVGKEIAIEAKKKKICGDWFSQMLKMNDIKPLCAMYFRGDDWAMENDFPSVEILRRFKGNSNRYGLHTDFIGMLDNQHNCALFGTSDVELMYDGFFVGKLIIRHNSKANIEVKGNAFLVINALDNADLTISTRDEAKVVVYNYHSTTSIKWQGNVSVKQSNFEK